MFCIQELAAVVRDPASALFQQVPEDSGLYQPSEKAHVQSDTMDVVLMYRSLGVVVAKAVAARACFPLRFTQYAPSDICRCGGYIIGCTAHAVPHLLV